MKRRRLAASCLAMAMTVVSAAGCSSGASGGGSNPQTSTEAVKESVEMTTGAAAENKKADDWSGFVKDGKTVIRVGIEADPGTMDPYTTGSSNGKNATIKTTVYQTLAIIQGVGGELAPEIAKDWERVDSVTYDIEIFDYVCDSAGNHITADDVVFSYETCKASGSTSVAKYIVSIEKTGDYTVRLVLDRAAVTLFERIMQTVFIVSQKAYEESPDHMAISPVMTGPYKVVDWISGSSMVLERNENYWQKPELAAKDINQIANVDRLEYYVIKEASQLAIALETGTIDMVYNLDATEAQRFMAGGESAEGFNVFTSVNNLTQTMFLNVNEASKLYDNLPLRQAVLYAFDSEAMVDGASNGFGVTCKTFGSNLLPDFDEKWSSEAYYEYDPEKAKALLKEAGYGDGEVTLRIVTNNSTMRNKIAQILQAYLLQAGIKSEILPYEDTLFNTYKNDPTQWDLLLDNCGTSDQLMGMWRGKMDQGCCAAGSANMAMDDELQRLVAAAENPDTNGPETVDALHQYMKENAYVYGIYNNLTFTICRDVTTDISMSSLPWLMPAGCTYVWSE